MTHSVKHLLAACTIGLLAACSSNDIIENPVSPLPEINQSIAPELLWQAKVGNGVGDYYSRLKPSVRYGKVFAASRDGEVAAFEQATGVSAWEQDFRKHFRDNFLAKNKGARLAGGVTVARDKVFIGSESGFLAALNAENGELAWTRPVNGEVLSAPAVAEDMVAVNTSAGVTEAFNVDEGKHLWSYESLLPSLTLRGTGSLAYEGGGFFTGTADGKIAVIIKDNGQPAWEQPVYVPTGGNEFSRMADVDMTPLILGDKLYAVSYNGNLVSMELRSGRVLWKRKYSSFHNLALDGISIFLVDDHSRIYSVDRRNGLELWGNSLLSGRKLTSPVVYQNYILVGDFEGYLHFIEAETGKIAGRMLIDKDGLYTAPVVADDKIFVQGRSGKLVAVTIP